MLATIAALFISMLALPQTAQAQQNTVTIDGVEKTILYTRFSGDDDDFRAFLSANGTEYVCIEGNRTLHATYNGIDLTKKEPKHDGQGYRSVDYLKDGKKRFYAVAEPNLYWALFTNGLMYIFGDPRPSRKVCGISLYNGEITDTKHGDGKKHSIKIDYKYERTAPKTGKLTVDNVTDRTIDLWWTHGSDNVTPQDKLYRNI